MDNDRIVETGVLRQALVPNSNPPHLRCSPVDIRIWLIIGVSRDPVFKVFRDRDNTNFYGWVDVFDALINQFAFCNVLVYRWERFIKENRI
ncbi:hypothetical protein D3C73_454510 [compost metagenome]